MLSKCTPKKIHENIWSCWREVSAKNVFISASLSSADEIKSCKFHYRNYILKDMAQLCNAVTSLEETAYIYALQHYYYQAKTHIKLTKLCKPASAGLSLRLVAQYRVLGYISYSVITLNTASLAQC